MSDKLTALQVADLVDKSFDLIDQLKITNIILLGILILFFIYILFNIYYHSKKK